MAKKDSKLYVVSKIEQELKTSLTTVKGFTQVIKKMDLSTENKKIKHYLNVIETSSNRLISAVDRLEKVLKTKKK